MEVYDCSVDIFQFFGPKMGLKPAQGRPVQCFQHKKSLFTSFQLLLGMKSLLDTLRSDKIQISKNTLFSETPFTSALRFNKTNKKNT